GLTSGLPPPLHYAPREPCIRLHLVGERVASDVIGEIVDVAAGLELDSTDSVGDDCTCGPSSAPVGKERLSLDSLQSRSAKIALSPSSRLGIVPTLTGPPLVEAHSSLLSVISVALISLSF